MMKFGKFGHSFVIIDSKKGITLELTKADAIDLGRELIKALNVTEAKLNDGRDLFKIDSKLETWKHGQN